MSSRSSLDLANAEHCRRQADSVHNENVRQRYLNLARKWEELAKETTDRQESLCGRHSVSEQSDHQAADLATQAACKLGLEGTVSKRVGKPNTDVSVRGKFGHARERGRRGRNSEVTQAIVSAFQNKPCLERPYRPQPVGEAQYADVKTPPGDRPYAR